MAIPDQVECLVVGGGPAGLAAGAALAALGVEVVLAGWDGARGPASGDTRTAALFPGVVQLLHNLGAWSVLEPVSAPLLAIRLIDAKGHLLRAPEVTFRASEIGLPELAWNVPNAELAAALAVAAGAVGVGLLADGAVTEIEPGPDRVVARLASGRRLAARLVVAADGRESICRAAAGIDVRRWSYDQSAIAARFSHSRPHRGISTELHGAAGPCTTVPLPGLSSSLVWVEKAAAAARLMQASAEEFATELAERLGGLLGELHDVGARRCFPVSSLVAGTLGRSRIALVGEAGHVLPPIGAQGLNLGMFDAATLADLVADARAGGRDIGAPDVLAAYTSARKSDMSRRVGAVDLLNRSLTAGLLPLDLARGAGLHLLAAMPALRRRMMIEGLAPPGPLPHLMRPAGKGSGAAHSRADRRAL